MLTHPLYISFHFEWGEMLRAFLPIDYFTERSRINGQTEKV